MIGAIADLIGGWRRRREDRRYLESVKLTAASLRANADRFINEVDMLSTDHTTRKGTPLARGVLDYFPDALAAVAAVSLQGSQQHNTWDEEGNPRWDKGKSTDHADCIIRHLADRGTIDSDGQPHSAKAAWRALALLQIEIDNARPSPWAGEAAAADVVGYAEDKVAQEQPKLSEAAEFATWLTTRKQCVHVGALHTVYQMFDALSEWETMKAADKIISDAEIERMVEAKQAAHLGASLRGMADAFVGLDPAKPGSDKSSYVLYGEPGIPVETFAKALGVSTDEILDLREPRVNGKPIYDERVSQSVGESVTMTDTWGRGSAKVEATTPAPKPFETFEDWKLRRLGHGPNFDAYAVSEEYDLWAAANPSATRY